ncbi:hypothetical protein JRQ81_001381 [Phrynocephalus forsythii]|uniref:Neuropilin C-terminal domain-containing protein n=1 Tax=Phrynocephalus forsythii TaxID=171643 RepID=A0A9Q0Y9X0_9SAUR|nr:hypothetical protein JRQ81_001381 [Phrynocephalus forsythii]
MNRADLTNCFLGDCDSSCPEIIDKFTPCSFGLLCHRSHDHCNSTRLLRPREEPQHVFHPFPVTPKVDKEKSWLYTLDPILVTIIAMSSLGVLLGAICAGLLLYCTCSYTGLSSRSSTTLENYNFELYDGIKHKVKMNHQKCCSEA